MSSISNRRGQIAVPFLQKKYTLYLGVVLLTSVIVFFFNAEITRLLAAKSLSRTIILFLILPLSALLTRPCGDQRAIGFIYAIKGKKDDFWLSTLRWWGISVGVVIAAVLLLLAWKYYKLAAGVSNWLYCSSFFVLLVNLIPGPPSPSEPGGFKLSIGLWGPADSGKTVFLGMLHDDPDRKWEMRFATAKTSDYAAAVRDAFDNKKWPEKTMLSSLDNGTREPLTFYFGITGAWYPYMGAKYISAAIESFPGSLFEKSSADEFKKDTDAVFQKLALSDGALFVVDHRFSNKREKFRTILEANLDRLLHECDSIGIIKKIPFPVAIAVSKTDTIYPDYLDSKDDPEALFLQLFGEEAHILIKEKIRTFKIFFFSSIGVKTVNGREVPRTHRKKGTEVPDKDPEPFGLFAPLEWLVAHSRKYAKKEKTKKWQGR